MDPKSSRCGKEMTVGEPFLKVRAAPSTDRRTSSARSCAAFLSSYFFLLSDSVVGRKTGHEVKSRKFPSLCRNQNINWFHTFFYVPVKSICNNLLAVKSKYWPDSRQSKGTESVVKFSSGFDVLQSVVERVISRLDISDLGMLGTRRRWGFVSPPVESQTHGVPQLRPCTFCFLPHSYRSSCL